MSAERIVIWLVLAGALASAGAAAGYFEVSLPDGGRAEAEAITGGNVERGRQAIGAHGCGTCHTIPGIRTARGLVGPPLDRIGERIYVAGMLPNTTGNLIEWITHPMRVNPRTAMPDTGLSEAEARDIAAFLYRRR